MARWRTVESTKMNEPVEVVTWINDNSHFLREHWIVAADRLLHLMKSSSNALCVGVRDTLIASAWVDWKLVDCKAG